MLKREEAREILLSMMQDKALLRHARTIELVMEAYAKAYGEDVEKWAIAGMLHDADYEKYPEQHPSVIVQKLMDMGETDIAYAISAHYTKWNKPYNSLMDKALLACDELTGFIMACCWIRPTKVVGLTAKSVKEKLKTLRFAAKVDREEIYKGAELFGVDLTKHIEFIIGVLTEHKEELEIG
jgi:predicted hydrolase (HD superfamily)